MRWTKSAESITLLRRREATSTALISARGHRHTTRCWTRQRTFQNRWSRVVGLSNIFLYRIRPTTSPRMLAQRGRRRAKAAGRDGRKEGRRGRAAAEAQSRGTRGGGPAGRGGGRRQQGRRTQTQRRGRERGKDGGTAAERARTRAERRERRKRRHRKRTIGETLPAKFLSSPSAWRAPRVIERPPLRTGSHRSALPARSLAPELLVATP